MGTMDMATTAMATMQEAMATTIHPIQPTLPTRTHLTQPTLTPTEDEGLLVSERDAPTRKSKELSSPMAMWDSVEVASFLVEIDSPLFGANSYPS